MSQAIPKSGTLRPVDPFAEGEAHWQEQYARSEKRKERVTNRSGIEVKPLYTPQDWDSSAYMEKLGFPGQLPLTRGIYPTMHRGRPWSQRQLIGFSTPEAFNERQHAMIASGTDAVSLIPCNSVFRGYDMDEVDVELLGTCGTLVNSVEDMARCLEGIDLERVSIGLNDPSPFTLSALFLAHARQKGADWKRITGTSNQSDYISHFIANHMFFRLALPGARRVLIDHIAFMRREVPGWNPISVVGQHMQQAGATPAEAMAFTLSTAIQYAEDCIARGLPIDTVLPRFSFFFDISVSFFEEVAKLRAGRRIWAKLTKERLGATDPRSWRFRFHSQTSGADLTRQQPLNNVTRVAVQAMAAIFGGTQSLHTDAYDEALSAPSERAARIAVNTQNILREEAHLADVIDPLGGSFYVENLTDEMEAKIWEIIGEIDAAGGMYKAAEQGVVQRKIGASARGFQEQVESGEQPLVGVNAYRAPPQPEESEIQPRTDLAVVEERVARLKRYKAERDQGLLQRGLDGLARAANSDDENVYGAVVEAASSGATHGEICALLRREYGFGQPLPIV